MHTKAWLPLACMLLTGSGILAAAENRPNVIIVMADDMGYGDVSAYNAQGKIPTPHIDRLAREGMKFTDAHTASGVCTPTRYSLLTGRYHWRTRLQSGVLGGFSRALIARDRLTLGGLFKRQGYHTACIGKWHLGMNWPLKGGAVADDGGNFDQPFADVALVDYTAPITDGPVDRGFDHFYGISASLDMFPYVWLNDRLPTEVATVEKAFHRPGPAGEKFEAIDVQGGIVDHTIAYLGQRARAAQAGQPFFAYVPLAAPHTPIVPTPEWQGKSGINPYADFVRQVDADMGRLLDALERHELSGDTLLVFTTDNGCSPAANLDQLRAAGHNPSYIYRGHKADLYEGGHRVPFLVRWPGKVPAGSVSEQLIGQFDFLATFAELLGVALPPAAGEDSVSFLPALFGTDDGPIRTSLISQSMNGSFAIRDSHWKLALCPGSGGWSFPRPGQNDQELPEFQLFNLEADPGEQTNLVAKYPERVTAMQAALATAIARGRTTPGPDQQNDVPVVMIKPAPTPARGKAGSQPKPLNVLFIAADDLRTDLGCYGHPLVKTPHIDRLARRGLVFRQAYCQQAVCNPSRASILTGRRLDTLRVWDLATHFRTHAPDLVTLPQHFKNHGYFTQNIGKLFHNWIHVVQGDPDSWSVPAVMHFANHNSDQALVSGELPPSSAHDPKCECRDVADDAYFDGRVAGLAVAALQERKARGEPFFLAVGFWKPHAPFNAPRRYWDLYQRDAIPLPANPDWPQDAPRIAWHDSREILGTGKAARQLSVAALREIRHGYLANISYLDAQVGRVIDELDRLQLADHTVIVFWSDHGYHLGEHGLFAKTSNFELDARVPLIIVSPTMQSAGQSTDSLAELLDLYPTLVDLCQLPKSPGTAGVSLTPILKQPAAAVRDAALTQHSRPAYFDREPAKTPSHMGYSIRTPTYRYTEWRHWTTGETTDRELYDHRSDPQETRNLAGDSAHQATIQQHAALLEKMRPVVTPGWKPLLP